MIATDTAWARPFESHGSAVAAALVGAWRKSPPSLEMSGGRVAEITPLLRQSGAGALGWWRLRYSEAQVPPTAIQQLRNTYLQYAIHAAEQERQIAEAFRVLRSADIEPILLRGWAVGRLYPESGLRPSGDIDLYVPSGLDMKARAALDAMECQQLWVDLKHDEITRFSDRSFDELNSCSELVKLGENEIRVLGPEDNLRFLCLHLLKHGAWRPLWLCDVAAALESRPADFDWDRCMGENKRHADWVLCTIALANRLLGAEIGDTLAKNRVNTLPGWLVSSVLKQWNAPYPANLPLFVNQMRGSWWKPSILDAVRRRWPNPIQSTVDAGGKFDSMTRLPFQLASCAVRTAKLCRQLPALARK
jgi:hypothetical protein